MTLSQATSNYEKSRYPSFLVDYRCSSTRAALFLVDSRRSSARVALFLADSRDPSARVTFIRYNNKLSENKHGKPT